MLFEIVDDGAGRKMLRIRLGHHVRGEQNDRHAETQQVGLQVCIVTERTEAVQQRMSTTSDERAGIAGSSGGWNTTISTG